MKKPIKLLSRRSRQVALSAAVLVAASTAGVLVARPDDPARPDTTAASVAELSRSAAASRAQERLPAAPASPSVSPSTAGSTPSAGAPAASPAAPRTTTAPDPDLSASPTPARPPATKVLDIEYQEQSTYYYCGPAATRIALTARGIVRSQDDLARRLNTTEFGTNSAEDTTRVMNDLVGRDVYQTRMIPGSAATAAQTDRLRADVVETVGSGYAVVVNVAGTATDVAGGWHSFPGGHYVAVVGYRDGGRTVKIADSASAATSSYWMSIDAVADWVATRGYSA
ncbi:C39 family peptidase [Micromonospora cathayae]|uniref:C39 family peptidase n=1 Tax=Micromonospora cathayae TaxID=3028804 RepID=A0ABY7ZXK5_9ACTN|nr:C39 family peptidase [Micromonospora sp. HUAS 3]WDZ87801.1 C39 family peptidase [Micromonospora sp. HUAS 3]